MTKPGQRVARWFARLLKSRDTVWADVSEFQADVDDAYPYAFVAVRSNDGTYADRHFVANLAWIGSALRRRRLLGFLVYLVFEADGRGAVATFKSNIGRAHRARMAVMIDVESWAGKIAGDHSREINAARESLIAWLHSLRPAAQRRIPLVNRWYLRLDRRRVIGYGNAGDLESIWPRRGDARVILANYSANPRFPGKIGHQFACDFEVPPFGKCDINSADGRSPQTFARQLGLGLAFRRPKPPRRKVKR